MHGPYLPFCVRRHFRQSVNRNQVFLIQVRVANPTMAMIADKRRETRDIIASSLKGEPLGLSARGYIESIIVAGPEITSLLIKGREQSKRER